MSSKSNSFTVFSCICHLLSIGDLLRWWITTLVCSLKVGLHMIEIILLWLVLNLNESVVVLNVLISGISTFKRMVNFWRILAPNLLFVIYRRIFDCLVLLDLSWLIGRFIHLNHLVFKCWRIWISFWLNLNFIHFVYILFRGLLLKSNCLVNFHFDLLPKLSRCLFYQSFFFFQLFDFFVFIGNCCSGSCLIFFGGILKTHVRSRAKGSSMRDRNELGLLNRLLPIAREVVNFVSLVDLRRGHRLVELAVNIPSVFIKSVALIQIWSRESFEFI